MPKQTIINVTLSSKDRYTPIHNDILRNHDITGNMLKVLALCLSYGQGKWRFSRLLKQSGMGRTTVYSCLGKLKKLGYVKMEKERDEKGQICGCSYNIADAPVYLDRPCDENQEVVKGPLLENPDTENPDTENPDLEIRSPLKAENPLQTKNPLKTKKGGEKTAAVSSEEIPLQLRTQEFMATWRDWEAHRKEIGHPLTPQSIKQQLNKCLGFGHDGAIEALQHSIMAGYRGLFGPDDRRKGPKSKQPAGGGGYVAD